MLPTSYRAKYREFKQALEQLQEMATSEAAAGGSTADAPALWEPFSGVQQFFGREILGVSAGEISPEVASRIQSFHTEMHKQLRLLGTDVMFLRSARSPETLRARQIQVSDRLKTLIGYCSALLEEC